MAFDKKKLVEDLKAARAAAVAAASGHDDCGTCNMDSAMLVLPRGTREKSVAPLFEQAGLSYFRHDSGGYWGGMYSIHGPEGGQGNRRTAQAEAIAKVLRERGWTTHIYYQMD